MRHHFYDGPQSSLEFPRCQVTDYRGVNKLYVSQKHSLLLRYFLASL